MRAAILARVSTAGQADADRHSLPYQLEAMVEYAGRRGWDVVATYEIPGESAWKWNLFQRPQFSAVLAAAERREFDALLVYDVSRLARNQAVLHEARRLLMAAGCSLWSVTGDYDVVADGMRAGLEGLIAEQSSNDHSRRVKAAFAKRHRAGMHTGDVPFGYDPRSLAVIPEEAEAIRWGFGAYSRGVGFLAIATEWNRRGLRPRSKRGLLAFTVSSVQSVIESRFYLGLVSHLGNERPGLHEAIVTEELWQAAQDRTRKHGPAGVRYNTLLHSLAECAHCFGPVWTKRAGQMRHVYYWEPSRVRARECAATGLTWRAEEVDAQIARAVAGMRLEGEWLEWARDIARRQSSADHRPQDRARLLAKRERVRQAFEDGMRSRESAREEIARIDAELAAMPADIVPRVLQAGASLTDMATAWSRWTETERHTALTALLDGVLLDIPGRAVALKPTPEFASYFEARHEYLAKTKSGPTPDRTRTLIVPTGYFALAEWAA